LENFRTWNLKVFLHLRPTNNHNNEQQDIYHDQAGRHEKWSRRGHIGQDH